MLFHTPQFLIFFLVFLAFYLPVRHNKWGVRVIVVFSSIFYGSWNWKFLPLLWVTIVVDFVVGYFMGKTENRQRRQLVWVSVACNLGILGYFKYWNFLIHTIGGDSIWAKRVSLGEIVLPLGISFYVFQSMSYIIDIYRGKQNPLKDLWEFAAFVTFFPHLIAGPIQRIQQLVPQILNPDRITYNRVASALFTFAMGLFKKCLGDTLASWHDPIFQNLAKTSPAEVVLAVFSFGLQIYLDFSGYSEMAVAIARTLGIDLIWNFKAPYLSESIRDYWRRWHISLSLWLRDYLYISLGGSRAGFNRQMVNLLFTMTICGLWHGAGWNFAIWGLLHGIYLVSNTAFSKVTGGWFDASPVRRAISSVLFWALTYLSANYAWIYFRIPTFDGALLANEKFLAWLRHPMVPHAPQGVFGIFAIVFVLDLFTRLVGELFPVESELTLSKAVALGVGTAALFVTSMVLSAGQPTQQFIYFQF